MNPENVMLSEISQTQKNRSCVIPQYETPRAVKFIETEGRMVLAGGWRRGNGELLFNGYKISV